MTEGARNEANQRAMGIAILVVGIVSVMAMPLLGPVALILFALHRRDCARTGTAVRVEAKIGAALAVLGIAVFLAMVVVTLLVFAVYMVFLFAMFAVTLVVLAASSIASLLGSGGAASALGLLLLV